MQAYVTLMRRELGSFFVSATGFLVIAAAAFLQGLSWVVLVAQLQAEPTPLPITQLFYSTPYFWLILQLATPVITMRLFALEKASGTFETLMTTPVTELQVVLAKYTAALVFYVLLWLPSLACVLILRHFINTPTALDPGLLASTFLGITLLGGLFMALGCFASALAHTQIMAAMLSFTLGFTLFLLSLLSGRVTVAGGWQEELLTRVALMDHMNDFARGLVDVRHLVFYLSLTAWFLFLTVRVVESRRWK